MATDKTPRLRRTRTGRSHEDDDERALRTGPPGRVLPATAAARSRRRRRARRRTSRRACSRRSRFDQNLDAQLPLDLPLRDEQGQAVTLGDYFGRRPVIVNLVYYECPMLCNEVLNSLLRSLNALTFDVGKEFDVVTVSIDPGETPALAARKKAAYLKRYGRPGADQGWHFLTGDEPSIRRLADAVGFHYVYDPQSRPVRPPGGDRDRDAAGADRPLLLRHQLPGARPPARPDRGGRRQDRLADRPDSPHVLPLRSQDGQVQRRDHERDPPPRAA